MDNIIVPFLLLIACILIPVIGTAAINHRHLENVDIDSKYYDQNGDHIYYERSLIEKKKYHRLYTEEAVRTFVRLFNRQ